MNSQMEVEIWREKEESRGWECDAMRMQI